MKINIQILSLLTLFIVAGLILVSCSKESSDYVKIEPAHIEHIENSKVEKLTLTEKAADRLDIKTTKVRQVSAGNDQSISKKIVPYASVLYDTEGKTWVYTNPENLVYIRHEIVVDYIEGKLAWLNDGPPLGTEVVIQGASELLGTEYHVGH